MKKPRYTHFKSKQWWWEPSATMREHGYHTAALGADDAAAWRKAKLLNAEWDTYRIHMKKTTNMPGDINWIISKFERDPTWYGDKAVRTKEEMQLAFKIIGAEHGPYPVRALTRKHLRGFYNELRLQKSAHHAKRVLKWYRRLLEYAMDELEIIYVNPAHRMKYERLPGRDAKWTPEEIDAIIETAMTGGVTTRVYNIATAFKKAGQTDKVKFKPRLSVALAVAVANDTLLRLGDILSLTWKDYDGAGITAVHQKTGAETYGYLSPATKAMIDDVERVSTHIIVNEETVQPYTSVPAFGRVFRKMRARAGITRDIRFQDLRRTGASELADKGATEADLSKIGGWRPGSSALKQYVRPSKAAAKRAAELRWGTAQEQKVGKMSESRKISQIGKKNDA